MQRAETFAEELKRLRIEAGFAGLPELARRLMELGYRKPNYTDLRRYELGTGRPNLDSFSALVDALGLAQNDIMWLVRNAYPRPYRMPRPMSHPLRSVDEIEP
jgi:hypothetical protein